MRSLQLGLTLAAACGPGGPATAPDAAGEVPARVEPQPLGAACAENDECKSGLCLKSSYAPPFCSRACDQDCVQANLEGQNCGGDPCPAGVDAGEGDSLCVSYAWPPYYWQTPEFKSELTAFCVPRCHAMADCTSNNGHWEVCDVPEYLGDPLYPVLGDTRVCMATSYHGKDPVDPKLCDWQKTLQPEFSSQAVLCGDYCAYLEACKEVPVGTDHDCCQWGCYNRVVSAEGKLNDPWYDQVKCMYETHLAYPREGVANACTEPKKLCELPYELDPTPPSARPTD
jgi:hypothetical protein